MWYEGVRSAHIMSITVKKYVHLESPLYPFYWIQGSVYFDFLIVLNYHFFPLKILKPRVAIQILFICSFTLVTVSGKDPRSSNGFLGSGKLKSPSGSKPNGLPFECCVSSSGFEIKYPCHNWHPATALIDQLNSQSHWNRRLFER